MVPNLGRYASEKEIAQTFENQVLYKMCLKFPENECAYVIAGKVTAIGRIYAAPPARGAGKAIPNGKPLEREIGERLAASKLGRLLSEIEPLDRISEKGVFDKVVKAHEYLVEEISAATGAWKDVIRKENWTPKNQPSFASKYLHFHRPNAFPIMDSFAKKGLRVESVSGSFSNYRLFCEGILRYSNISNKHGDNWTPRGLDTELVKAGREQASNKV